MVDTIACRLEIVLSGVWHSDVAVSGPKSVQPTEVQAQRLPITSTHAVDWPSQNLGDVAVDPANR